MKLARESAEFFRAYLANAGADPDDAGARNRLAGVLSLAALIFLPWLARIRARPDDVA